MNLYLRMLLLYLASLRRERITPENMHSRLSLRVWVNDLDMNRHMNNGRYLTICDLSRVDMFIRSGLLALMIRNRWHPIIKEHTMTYVKPSRPFQRFDLDMRIVRWDDKFFHCTHLFSFGGKTAAEGTSVAGIRNREGMIPPDAVLKALDLYQQEKFR